MSQWTIAQAIVLDIDWDYTMAWFPRFAAINTKAPDDLAQWRCSYGSFPGDSGYEAWFGTCNTHNFVVYSQKHKVWVLIFLEQAEYFETKFEQIRWNFLFFNKTALSTATTFKERCYVFHQMGLVIKQLFHACL